MRGNDTVMRCMLSACTRDGNTLLRSCQSTPALWSGLAATRCACVVDAEGRACCVCAMARLGLPWMALSCLHALMCGMRCSCTLESLQWVCVCYWCLAISSQLSAPTQLCSLLRCALAQPCQGSLMQLNSSRASSPLQLQLQPQRWLIVSTQRHGGCYAPATPSPECMCCHHSGVSLSPRRAHPPALCVGVLRPRVVSGSTSRAARVPTTSSCLQPIQQ